MKLRILLLFSVLISGYSNFKSDLIYTPERYLNMFPVSQKKYYVDSLRILDDIMVMVKKNEQDFYAYKYPFIDPIKTAILIDTIIYDSSRTKQLILLAIKTFDLEYYRGDINGKEVKPKKRFLHDGFAILAKMNAKNRSYKNYYIQVGNYGNQIECFERLREIYFHELGPMQETEYNRYNMDDKRIWSEPIWKKF